MGSLNLTLYCKTTPTFAHKKGRSEAAFSYFVYLALDVETIIHHDFVPCGDEVFDKFFFRV